MLSDSESLHSADDEFECINDTVTIDSNELTWEELCEVNKCWCIFTEAENTEYAKRLYDIFTDREYYDDDDDEKEFHRNGTIHPRRVAFDSAKAVSQHVQ